MGLYSIDENFNRWKLWRIGYFLISVIFSSSTFLLTSFVEWYRAPSQVIMKALFLSPYLIDRRLSSSSMNATNTSPFVLSLLIVVSSNASTLIAAITEYLMTVVLEWKILIPLCCPCSRWAGQPWYRKLVDLNYSETHTTSSFDEVYVSGSMVCNLIAQNLERPPGNFLVTQPHACLHISRDKWAWWRVYRRSLLFNILSDIFNCKKPMLVNSLVLFDYLLYILCNSSFFVHSSLSYLCKFYQCFLCLPNHSVHPVTRRYYPLLSPGGDSFFF